MRILARMTPLVLLSIFFASQATAAEVRTMANLPGVPFVGLRVVLPAEAYQRLINAPVKAWIMVRGQIIDNKVFGARVVHSEANGVYDKVAVQLANGMELDAARTGTRLPPSVIVHILIYQLPHGEDAFCIAQNDSVGDSNLIYSRSIKMRSLGLKGGTPPAKKTNHK